MDTIIYVRWSSAEQSKGQSEERQLSLCRAHAQQRGWNVVRTFIDNGMSAFTGEHRQMGELSKLEQEIRDKRYPNGVILLVERLDRLSREAPSQFYLWLDAITRNGVTVATVDGDRTYSGSLDMASIIEVVVKASLANDESVAKSRRVASAWASKRARLAAGDRHAMTMRVPAWLSVNDDRTFSLHAGRAAIIKRIFEETAQGSGKHTIARQLNSEGVPTFGRSAAWHASYIQKILNSPAVLGEFQPGVKPRGAKRKLVDQPISNYYPAVIDADLYSRARTSMQSRSRKSLGRGRRIANLFSGLARCGTCGSKMTLRSKGKKTRADGRVVYEDYLVCDKMQRGIISETGEKCRNNLRYNYSILEKGVLDAILSDAMDDTHFADVTLVHQLAIEHAEKKIEWERLKRKSKSMLELWEDDRDDEDAKHAYRKAREDHKVLKAAIDEIAVKLMTARGKATPEEHAARIASVRADMSSMDEETRLRARTTVRLAISELVQELTFHRKAKRIGVKLLSGSRNITISADDGRVTFDIIPPMVSAPVDGLSERQVRVRSRVLRSNRARRPTK
ncbi:recombinase family protein [Stakelama marina]|uniref:Recombinase family protein n=1 Tax=Stakelama marina TaxID=2826939 RepID=A0A8T4ICD4_9SPHN|nr:recombinase family protein [Stakelama marina]MBR0552051.1 recombinase family protein [Stakelama marina]